MNDTDTPGHIEFIKLFIKISLLFINLMLPVAFKIKIFFGIHLNYQIIIGLLFLSCYFHALIVPKSSLSRSLYFIYISFYYIFIRSDIILGLLIISVLPSSVGDIIASTELKFISSSGYSLWGFMMFSICPGLVYLMRPKDDKIQKNTPQPCV